MSPVVQRALSLLDAPMAWTDLPHGLRRYIPCGTSGQALSVRLAPAEDLTDADVLVVCCDWGDADAAQQMVTLPDAAALAYDLTDGACGYRAAAPKVAP